MRVEKKDKEQQIKEKGKPDTIWIWLMVKSRRGRNKKLVSVSRESPERVLMGKSLKSSPKHVPLIQAGIQHTSSRPFDLAQLPIMATLWSSPPCKDIFAPIQQPVLHLSQFCAERREKGLRRKSKTIYCDRLLDFLLPACLPPVSLASVVFISNLGSPFLFLFWTDVTAADHERHHTA